MNQDLTADLGYRTVEAGSSSSENRSDVQIRADRSSPGEWDEDLGRWGSDDWHLPGEGESGPGCGEWYAEGVCETCGYLDTGTHSCGRRSCPDCWGIWAKEAAVRATQRIQAFRYTLPDDWHRQVAHAVVSPPEGDVMNEREYWKGRKRAAEMAEQKGFRGFTVIPHSHRVKEAAKEEYRALDPDIGIWVWLRNEKEDIHEWIHWSPHYHIIGVTSADMEPAKEGDEWAYSFIRSLKAFNGKRDSESHNDLYGVFRYLLSHTGFPERSTKQVVTWYGDMANSVFVEKATEDWQHEKPSEGVLSVLRREIEKVAGPTEEDDESDESGPESDERNDCPKEDCGGVVIDVFDVSAYIRQAEPPPDIRDRMRAARDWRLGEIAPPPGLKNPQTDEQAREAFEAML